MMKPIDKIVFTRQHYHAIAHVIGRATALSSADKRYIVMTFAHHFEQTQEGFNRDKFLEICGITTSDPDRPF